MTDTVSASQLLEFWFGHADPAAPSEFREAWFRPDPAFDHEIKTRFAAAHERAAAGALDHLAASPAGALALVLLLDQVPRNIFRGSARAFATDRRALAIARDALDRGFDQGLRVWPRCFLYLPFEHSEDLADQDRAVALIGDIGEPRQRDYAHRHRDVIARFGRFPHRNEILGRESTPEELAFLKQDGSSF